MKTAVEYLHSEYKRILGSVLVTPQQVIEMSDALENAKEMEKEQIKTAYLNGNAFGIDIDNGLSPSHYYNETFKQQEQ